ncbi:hypothetical protein TUM19329_29450 [Legionella antarctica]|uniref:Uncharacterized protein n=1 Tax=Legionella antarctica TaxID=2708020 RepID=A0A6F8T7C1_9GAMM|nr:hypothetical protein [Legionella antarctica]BCA96584.1 hypothetical protein TUM19329_29450 [Legionella antarctica]
MILDKKRATLNNTIQLGIPKGLVAQRRADLIAAKFSGYAAVKSDEMSVVTRSESTQSDSRRTLNHLTKERPAVPHKPPSRRPRKLNETREFFFTEKLENRNEVNDSPLTTSLATLLKNAISVALSCYREHYQNGTHPRQPNGWFSLWRHGAVGQEKAKEVCVTIQEQETCNTLLDKLHFFFNSPGTRYENHSFASYLLDELDKLLHHISLPGCKVEGTSYDKNSWLVVAAQLEKVVPVEEKIGNTIRPS